MKLSEILLKNAPKKTEILQEVVENPFNISMPIETKSVETRPSGTFTTVDKKTVTVYNGIVTSIK